MEQGSIETYYSLSNDKLNLVGGQPWSFKESLIRNYNIVKEIPELMKFNVSIPIDSPVFVEALAKAENEAMLLILKKRNELAVPPVVALIDKSDYREIHNHLLVIFCKESHRRKLLSNWQLKRFVVDINYIFSHLGMMTLRYCDRKIPVSKKAAAIVKNLGSPTPAQVKRYTCENKKIMEVVRKADITIKNPQSKPNVVKRARLKIKRIVEQSSKSVDKSNVVEVFEGDYKVPNKVPEVSESEVSAANDKLGKVVVGEIKDVKVDEDLRSECIDSLNLVIKQNAKQSYKDALLKECEVKLKDLVGSMLRIRDFVRDKDEMDVNREHIMKNDIGEFIEEFREEVLGYDMFSPGLDKARETFRDYVRSERLSEERQAKEKGDFEKLRERNYQRRKVDLREEWADVYFGLKQTVFKIIELREKLKVLRIKFPKIVNYNWDIVMSDYFKNEAIKRAIKDLEFKKRNFNQFKLDRVRKQRARSIIDDFFGTRSVSWRKHKMYGSPDFKDDPKTLFIMRGLDYIMTTTMGSNYMGVANVRIEDYEEEIPFRRFTRNGVEIRDVKFIENVSKLCKRKFEFFSNEVNLFKKRDVKFGEISPEKENEMMGFFMAKVEEKLKSIEDCKSEIEVINLEIIDIEKKIRIEENKVNCPVIEIEIPMEEKICNMFARLPYDEEKCKKETMKMVKKEKKIRQNIIDGIPRFDEIDILNKNLENMFELRKGIITVKKEFDVKVNEEIESIELLPEEINQYRKSRLSEEVDKMKRYTERVMYMRQIDPENKYTKNLILMRFLRYQTLILNKNIGLECNMEERMFQTCYNKFMEEKGYRESESLKRYQERINEAIDRRIAVETEKREEERKERERLAIREFIKKEKDSMRRKGKMYQQPDIQVVKKLQNLIMIKKEKINRKLAEIERRERNLKLFRMKEKVIKMAGYNKEIIMCKKERIRKSVERGIFQSRIKAELTKGVIVEEKEETIDQKEEQRFISENIHYVKRLMFRNTEKINEIYRKRDAERYEREKSEAEYGVLQLNTW
jgi:hypothetical protein